MREILGMMQRMITETPALAEADPKFDASRLEDAIANEDPDSPTPGIVVIRNSDSAASADPDSSHYRQQQGSRCKQYSFQSSFFYYQCRSLNRQDSSDILIVTCCF